MLCYANVKNSNLRSDYHRHVVSLDKSEMNFHGENPKQHSAWLGVLFEVTKDGKQFYYKKPILSSYCQNLCNTKDV